MRYQEMLYGHEPGVGFVEDFGATDDFGAASKRFAVDMVFMSAARVNGTVVLGCECEPIVSIDYRDGHIVSIY